MKSRRTLRLLALLLSFLLALQCAAAAAEPESEPGAQEDPGTISEPAEGETPGQPPEQPPEETPEEIVLTANLTDGQVVNNPRQSLTVEAMQGQTALPPEQITVTLTGEAVAPEDDAYALKLLQGDNDLVITAVSGENVRPALGIWCVKSPGSYMWSW